MTTWISTGDAARLMGYSPSHFREKFEGVIPSRRPPGGGNRKWDEEAVKALLEASKDMPKAG